MEGFTDCYELNIREIQPEREREKVIRTYNICLFQYLKRQDLLEQVTIDVVLSVGKEHVRESLEILENLSLFASRLYDLMEFGAEETVEGSVPAGHRGVYGCCGGVYPRGYGIPPDREGMAVRGQKAAEIRKAPRGRRPEILPRRLDEQNHSQIG